LLSVIVLSIFFCQNSFSSLKTPFSTLPEPSGGFYGSSVEGNDSSVESNAPSVEGNGSSVELYESSVESNEPSVELYVSSVESNEPSAEGNAPSAAIK
jgi:hypothetical protein